MHDDDIELGHYGRVVRRSWWVVLLAAVVGALAAGLLVPGADTFYESRISVLLTATDSDISQGQDAISEDTEIGIAVSQLIGGRVIEGRDLTLAEWRENLVVSACLDANSGVIVDDACNSQILEFRYQGATPEEAQELVQLTANTYLEFRQDREQAFLAETVENLEAELEALETRSATERVALIGVEEDSIEAELIERSLREIEDTTFTVISQLTELRNGSVDVGDVLGDPSEPERGSAGIPLWLAIIAGAFLGLMVGAVIAIGLDRLNRSVTDTEELELDLGVPTLGNIAKLPSSNPVRSPALVTASGSNSEIAEGFRRVAAAALASRDGASINSIAIVGANEKEGRTTTAVNLSVAMSQAGRDVLLVNTDLQSNVIDEIFGIQDDLGLIDFLNSDADQFAAHYAIDQASQRYGIRVLSTGRDTGAKLSSNALLALVNAATERKMIVVFDTPPTLTRAGALQVAAIADVVHVVAAAGSTRRSDLKMLLSQLENVRANVGGAVFNRTSRLSLIPSAPDEVAAANTATALPDSFEAEQESTIAVTESQPAVNGSRVAGEAPRIKLVPSKLKQESSDDLDPAVAATSMDTATDTNAEADVESFSDFAGLFGTKVDGDQR